MIKNKSEFYIGFVLVLVCAAFAYFKELQELVLKTDISISLLINSTLSKKNWWTIYWGNMNSPVEQYASISSMVMISLVYIGLSKNKKNALSLVISMIFYLEVMLLIKFFVVRAFNISRLSPSYVIPNYQLLSKILEDALIKDSSTRSFPGDHAMVMFFIVFYSRAFYSNKLKIVTLVVAIIFVTPRVVSGAHWPSDIIYTVAIVFFYVNILVLTPIHDKTVYLIRSVINKSLSSVG